MNKLAKSAIAGTAGMLLLLGGAGTFALWNDTASSAAGAIDSGDLTLAASTGTWDSNPTNWVPGDTFEYSTTVTVVATGDNIAATLSVDSASITGDAELKAALDVDMTIAPLPAGITDNGDGTFDVTAAGTYTLPVVVTVSFDEAADNTTQDQSVDLSALGFVLQQTA